ncbi:MmcQ/YjbR family DNA-binding protein [Acinetobacter chinensis]|uniref:MmcQ/YjbR family DNA-binding protein n=1 Tax=Acinetobacter chinensis TaxID=2004650 RepID=A0ABU3WHK6_9GAMM|nr:MmcQ/YjbR family DNA-binding protein [Acinetobacter chinensis]MDV2469884.1 MmcQ/YjbR family DNA-binding protein [Acinetobacter chinensis]
MQGKEIQQYALQIATGTALAELCYPFGDDIPVVKIMGKVFLLTSSKDGEIFVNLKVTPEHGDMLRDIYSSIHTGYHMNKRHWISIYSGDQISKELIEDLVLNSYALVVQTLTKAQKQALAIHSSL